MKHGRPVWAWLLIASLLAAILGCRNRELNASQTAALTSDVTVSIVAVRALESVPSATVVAELSNHTRRMVTVTAYRVVWPSGSHTISGVEIPIAPGTSAPRTVRVDGSDFHSLTLENAHIEILRVR